MKKIFLFASFCMLLVSCGSSFQGFYDNHKADIGTTSFQVPNFMKAVLGNISPEIKHAIGNISDFKYIKFENIKGSSRQNLIAEMNEVTNSGFTDVFRKNEVDNTRIISVVENREVVTNVIIFNSNETETAAYYLQGNFNPEKIRSFADEKTFNIFSNDLIESYQTQLNSSFNPNN